ncbi:MAG: hypothetical protein R2873_21430 [Caldilineaceae bacterium]
MSIEEVALLVTAVLDQLDIPYLIGGSIASAYLGVPRATMDVDLVADIQPEHVSPFVHALESHFHVNGQTIVDAIIYRSSFNMIHLGTMFKVDIFLPKLRMFDKMQLERRKQGVLLADQTTWIASAEDTILAKLEWFRLGGETSERQWRDVLSVLKMQGDRIDVTYLRTWAAELGVSDLLEKALLDVTSKE